MLVIRFQKVLHLCIDEAQNAFVSGHLISNNIIAVYEILQSMRKKNFSRFGSFALKLDTSKVYDKVEWEFVLVLLRQMGFREPWVQKICMCLETVSYSVVLNVEVGELFRPSRGLRQGDPLNLYLFLVCGEGFSALLRSAVTSKSLRGYRINRYAPLMTHLFFTNNSLIFGEATGEGATSLKKYLNSYVSCSSQVVNFDKSRIFFSANVRSSDKNDVCAILGVNPDVNKEWYLSFPSVVGRNKQHAFRDLKEKVLKRVSGWSFRMLPVGGREVLIKVVLQAIPFYAMSCFLLPSSFCKELKSVIARFLWQKSAKRKRLHWCS